MGITSVELLTLIADLARQEDLQVKIPMKPSIRSPICVGIGALIGAVVWSRNCPSGALMGEYIILLTPRLSQVVCSTEERLIICFRYFKSSINLL